MIDIERYRRDGYLLVRDAFDPTLLEPFIDVLKCHVEMMSAELVAKNNLPSDYVDESFERRLGLLSPDQRLDNRLWDPVLFCQEFCELITHVALTGPLSALLGEEITYQGNAHLRPYLPLHLDRLPWHQDAQFYGSGTEHLLWQTVQVWLPLVDSPVDTGCLAVVAGSHRWGLLEGAVPGTDNVAPSSVRQQEGIYQRTAERVAFEPVTLLPMRRGDLLFFTNLLAHTGTENRSRIVRWSIDMRFEATHGCRPISCEERQGYEVMHRRILGRGYVPLRVRGAEGPESWADWERAQNARRSTPRMAS